MKLYGQTYCRQELVELVGDVEQLGGVTPIVLTEGSGNGTRAISVRSPGGLSFVCLTDRGMDLGWADYCGMPLAWRSPVADVSPAFAEHAGQGWLRSFGGGLITTCGLTSVGKPSLDGDEALGLHGRHSSTPARNVAWSVEWSGDERLVTLSGRVREASALGTVLELRRRITTELGGNSLRIEDVVINLGMSAAPNMFRYHVNLGFPLIDHESRIVSDIGPVFLGGIPIHDRQPDWQAVARPTDPVDEQVFTAETRICDGEAAASVINPGTRPSLRARWSGHSLPLLLIWKQPTKRTYVTALEPSNCGDGGRDAERRAGRLVMLGPGEERHYWLELSIGSSPNAPAVGPKLEKRHDVSVPTNLKHDGDQHA